MKIEITPENRVIKDGEDVGAFAPESDGFLPVEGLHPKTVKAIQDRLDAGKYGEEGKDEEVDKDVAAAKQDEGPTPDPKLGDKDPAYIAWYKKSHTKAEFEAKYRDRIYTE